MRRLIDRAIRLFSVPTRILPAPASAWPCLGADDAAGTTSPGCYFLLENELRQLGGFTTASFTRDDHNLGCRDGFQELSLTGASNDSKLKSFWAVIREGTEGGRVGWGQQIGGCGAGGASQRKKQDKALMYQNLPSVKKQGASFGTPSSAEPEGFQFTSQISGDLSHGEVVGSHARASFRIGVAPGSAGRLLKPLAEWLSSP